MKKAIFIVILLFLIAVAFLLNFSNKEVTLKDINQSSAPRTSTKESAANNPALFESPEKVVDSKGQVDYYIIVESFRNLTLAQQKAEKLQNDFKAYIIVLPVTKEGYYRVSFGKYTSIEAAKSSIKSVKTDVNPDAWIYSLIK